MQILHSLGYSLLTPAENQEARESLNMVLLKQPFIDAIKKINNIDDDTARAVYQEHLVLADDEKWLSHLRGNYSKKVQGESANKTIRLIDFLNIENNTFTATNQFTVRAEKTRIPDIVIFINGIPVVVIEAKSPVSFKDKTGEAFEQIRQYERDIYRLFYPNVFNIITNGYSFMYGATGNKSVHYGYWKDPWIKTDKDFDNELAKGYYCLLEPARLLDIIAHFVVFEKDDNQRFKKMCRYQQYRAVNKIVNRIVGSDPQRKGLIWHTQGSGKSLTMVFAALKLKTHLNIHSEILSSPNILILTDRVDLDEQISRTFENCGMANPLNITSKNELLKEIHATTTGKTILSTIFKFEGSKQEVANSDKWILLIDECHRTQEKDLGAYLNATFKNAWFFGFTGTPIKKDDMNTYDRFSPRGENYLDKYSIDDAVADGATIPIKYMSRKTEWQVEESKIDILFDQWFKDYTPEEKNKIQTKLSQGMLLKHSKRVENIAFDIWTHFKESAMKDGMKGQVVAYDREAIILYKRAFNNIITDEYVDEGYSEAEAFKLADSATAAVYSSAQEDDKPSEDKYMDDIRKDLVKYKLDEDEKSAASEKAIKAAFKKKGEAPWLLIVCSKLLTGFDAPVESVMYLDNPLKEHNLLQAIARTNRVYNEHKTHGMIVDYVGVTNHLRSALASYRREDVENALTNLDDIRSELRQAHAEVMAYLKEIKRNEYATKKEDYTPEFNALLNAIATLDNWYIFKKKAKHFLKKYSELSPEPEVLQYKRDMVWIGLVLTSGVARFEGEKDNTIENLSGKIREILEKELTATGLIDMMKLRSIDDTYFWNDFDTKDKSEEENKEAAIRKGVELKKTISAKAGNNPEQYKKFSERLKAILKKLEMNQTSVEEILQEEKDLADDIEKEESEHTKTGLSKEAYGVLKILESFMADEEEGEEGAGGKGGHGGKGGRKKNGDKMLTELQKIAVEITEIYSSDVSAPKGWQFKEEMKKELRQKVRLLAKQHELEYWKEIPPKVEEFALKHFGK